MRLPVPIAAISPALSAAACRAMLASAAWLLAVGTVWGAEAAERISAEEQAVSATSAASRSPVIRLGMMAFTSEGEYSTHVQAEDRMLRGMGELLNARVPQFRFEARFYRMDALQEAVKNEEVDLFLASSGFFWEMQRKYGARDLATLVTREAPDPNRGVAGTIFVKKDRVDLQTMADLKGKKLVAGRPNMFLAYQLAMGEVAAEGYDPDGFFSSIRHDDLPAETVVDAVMKGEADVGFLRACVLEYRYPDWAKQLRVISQKDDSDFVCAHSSELYPNWTLGATAKVPPAVLKHVAGVLLSLPPAEGLSWSLATDFKRIDDLEKRLRIGRYAYLRDWSWRGIWQRFQVPIVCVGIALAALLMHLLQVERLVAKRTRALTEEMQRRKQLEEEREAVRDRIERLERMQIVGQLSTMIAHDIKQPLAAAGYFVDGLQLLLKRPTLSVEKLGRSADKIRQQIERIAQIVDQVRRYAKREDRRDERCDIEALINKALSECKVPESIRVTKRGAPLLVRGNLLELECVFINLIRNAIEAQTTMPSDAFISIEWEAVSLEEAGEAAEIRIANDGPVLTQDDIARMLEPLVSSKPDGLGLGLEIARSIVEAHSGQFSMMPGSREKAGGITVRIILPMWQDETAAQTALNPNAEQSEKKHE